jgi:hypothetical protein
VQTSSVVWLREPLASLRLRRVAATDGRIVFVSLVVIYLAFAAIVAFMGHSVAADTWARVGNAYYVLFSRDPHLAAIGFVWLPLPSLLYLPLVAVHDLWPALVEEAYAAAIVSALFMAGSAYQLFGWLQDLRVSRVVRWVLVIGFAMHPLIAYYGANGMSEAIFLFFAIATGRYLTRWIVDDEPRTLIIVGVALAFAYLTRYEALAMAFGVLGAVGLIVAVRHPSSLRHRLDAVASDMVVVGLPFVAVFVGWALASWLITGHPFEQFSSIYGNENQVTLSTQFLGDFTGRGSTKALGYAAAQILGLAPLLAVPITLMFLIPVWRRDLRPTGLIVTLGAIVAMSLVVFLSGRSNGFLRFYIGVVPVAIVATGFIIAAVQDAARDPGRIGSGLVRGVPIRLQRMALVGGLVACVALSLPVGFQTMMTWAVAREEADQLADILPTSVDTSYAQDYYLGARAMADYIDTLHLPRGSVLLDTFALSGVVLSSTRPEQFVVTSDRDFKAIVAAPADFGVQYIAVPRNTGLTSVDAINLQYPELFDNGGGFATLVGQFGRKVEGAMRLYRIDR